MMLQAALNNAEWCDAMCRAHGFPGVFAPRAWTNPVRTPLFYPDAVTLSPDATLDDVLPGIDTGPGASIKDSFATLDLRPAGFEALIEATWIHRPAPASTQASASRQAAGGITWHLVAEADGLRAWELACFDGEPQGLFTAPLLTEPGIAILAGVQSGDTGGDTGGAAEADVNLADISDIGHAADKGGIVCGFVLNATRADDTVGVSNVFARPGHLDAAWAGTIAQAAALFPGRSLVGYESDPAPAAQHGFTPAGPLRIWLKSP
ncbi:hypothetical protein ACIBQX_32475 [Nonomuraea sp. NPDC049714]|uniref:hypothetical protein n=1 Tax=Nonomuraea sp. NPDC049714 TaxID=3364357 RepID=UPI0037A60477